jgi:hypothetical protein
VTTVAADGTDIGTVAGLSTEIAALGPIAADITTVAGIDSDVTAVAADATDIGTVAGSIANVNTVAGIDADVTTVAGISADVTAVAGDATDIGTVAGIAANVTTVAGIAANVTTVAGISSDVTTVATNVADITNFSDVYLGPAATDPATRNDSSALQEGDLYFNTVDDAIKVYTGSAWVTAYITADGFVTVADAQTITGVKTFDNGLNTDTISEETSAAGVTVDGVLLKDSQVTTDQINEKTSAAGVTIDGVLLKDSEVTTDVIKEKTSAAGVTIDGVLLKDNGVVTGAGTVSAPVYSTTGDLNTGIFFPAADTIAFAEGGAEAMRIDSSGNVGVAVVPEAWTLFKVIQFNEQGAVGGTSASSQLFLNTYYDGAYKFIGTGYAQRYFQTTGAHVWETSNASGSADGAITFEERMRIDTAGVVLIGKDLDVVTTVGHNLNPSGFAAHVRSAGVSGVYNRLTNDGNLVEFRQDSTTEGAISVSGSTVTYGGGHLARWGQLLDGSKDESLKKGTVLSNLDEMCVWSAPTTYWTEEDELPEGVSVGDVKQEAFTAENEQCNKIKVSDVEGDANVAGVFVSWTYDEQFNSNDLFVAMTGDMIIRIAEGVTVARGDLLMSAGDGTAKPQGDDIVRSKTIAKVTSTHVTCTYDDGSYCVPCVLMAC